MPEYTKEEAAAFIEAMRLAVSGKVGFKWLVEKLGSLGSYFESVADENARLNRYVDDAGLRADYEAHLAAQPKEPEDAEKPS